MKRDCGYKFGGYKCTMVKSTNVRIWIKVLCTKIRWINGLYMGEMCVLPNNLLTVVISPNYLIDYLIDWNFKVKIDKI